jgi:hypothetical protein
MATETDPRPLGINLNITRRRSLLLSRVLLNQSVPRPPKILAVSLSVPA